MIKKAILPLLLLATGAALVVQVGAKDQFDDKKFRDLLMERAENNSGMIQLDEDIIKELLRRAGMPSGEVENFGARQLLEFFSEGGQGLDLMPGLMHLSETDLDALEKQYFDLVDAHKPSTKNAAKSTVAFYTGDQLLVMGTIVSKDGHILTKASDFKKVSGKVMCDPGDGKRVPARIIDTFNKHDLALVKINRQNLTPVRFYTGELPAIGAFLTASGPVNEEPLGIGVLSVHPRSLNSADRAFLGIGLEAADDGIRVTRLLPDTAAERAGIRQGDIITQLDGKKYGSVPEFINAVSKREPGDEVEVNTLRNDMENSYHIKLGRRPDIDRRHPEGRFERMNSMGTRLSDRRDGYPQALQHDIPIEPEMVGGPVVDLNGHVLGINIARAGRVKTYAIPSKTLMAVLNEAKLSDAQVSAKSTQPDVERERLIQKLDQAKQQAEQAAKAANKAQLEVQRVQKLLDAHKE